MIFIKTYESFNLTDLTGIKCEFKKIDGREVYFYENKIGNKTVRCYAYDKGTKFDYSVDNSYSVRGMEKEDKTDFAILSYVKKCVYHHLMNNRPNFLELKPEDRKDRRAEKKKEKIYANFLLQIPKNIPEYKLNYNPDEDNKPQNVYIEGKKTTLLVADNRCEEHYYNGLLHSDSINPTETHIKEDVYLLSGYLPAIHWLDGKLDLYCINGMDISYPYVRMLEINGKKIYWACHDWELKKLGIKE